MLNPTSKRRLEVLCEFFLIICRKYQLKYQSGSDSAQIKQRTVKKRKAKPKRQNVSQEHRRVVSFNQEQRVVDPMSEVNPFLEEIKSKASRTCHVPSVIQLISQGPYWKKGPVFF